MTIRVLIVDDQELVRAGFIKLLEPEPDLRIVGEAADGAEAVEAAARTRPDVVLMDIRMPRLDGLEATRRIRKQPHPPTVLILTTYDLDEYVFEALKAGASGFLLKDAPPDQLLAGLRIVAAGDALLASATASKPSCSPTKQASSDPAANRPHKDSAMAICRVWPTVPTRLLARANAGAALALDGDLIAAGPEEPNRRGSGAPDGVTVVNQTSVSSRKWRATRAPNSVLSSIILGALDGRGQPRLA